MTFDSFQCCVFGSTQHFYYLTRQSGSGKPLPGGAVGRLNILLHARSRNGMEVWAESKHNKEQNRQTEPNQVFGFWIFHCYRRWYNAMPAVQVTVENILRLRWQKSALYSPYASKAIGTGEVTI